MSYGSFRGGALSLKGGMKKKKRKARDDDAAAPPTEAFSVAAGAGDGDGDDELQVLVGSGRISTSGTTVHGHDDTLFMREISVGDAIIVKHPATLCDETRIVKFVLSDLSLSISSPFSTDLCSTCKFRYIKAPKEEENFEAVADAKRSKVIREENAAFGTYASDGGTKFVYRTKHGFGYKIHTSTTDAAMTRESLLDMRAKKKSDRHCA